MAVCVVHVGKMRMFVNERGMLVNMGMRFTRWIIQAVLMLVVLVMHVGVGMLRQRVDMFMIVLLGRMQPDPQSHQPTCRQ